MTAKRLKSMSGSAIRNLLKQAGKKNFIALSGGYPDPACFPVSIIEELRRKIKTKYGNDIFQYGKTEGLTDLLDILPSFLKRSNRRVVATPDTIAITCGSQQALTIIALMFINPGDLIAVESPTYLGALQAFNAFQPRYVEILTDKDGMIPGSLENIIKKYPAIKFIYAIPTFQNPTGRVIPLRRRIEIAKIIVKYNKLLVEDDPYSEVRYEGDHLPSICSLAPANTIHLFTFSKTLVPDVRVGGMVASEEIKNTAVLIKQGLDLFTSNYNQALVSEYLRGDYLEGHLKKIIKIYRPRKTCMFESIKKYFPDIFEVTNSQGGMFVWVSQLTDAKKYKLNIEELVEKTLAKNVGFVPGFPFYANQKNALFSMRLNFTNQSEESIEKGIEIIGSAIHKLLK
ncbi:PLP-dependent aminotransferase family protein [Candidatus Roizmanbacteria bacterium CG_4_10_14_0_8_um_filter_39_9]|uniref:PLP-dependent aminotransferase family protein n=1 Tax=Candidatus Roizmanbacteria bacterium CG_4_10_14_0_8_um_filter_39_9 TaxID=1974829 RepID=A0A2M7QDT8_9BACT|nr:MAG: PLP-dependent aminotransferase family protein [Candidatus Roizmanbacteria bacterium CG_4_10_14_0_8_um_filter_39_9]